MLLLWIIDIEREQNEQKMNQMSFDEVIDQTRPPMVKSDIIDKFIGQIVDLARHSDFKDYGSN